MVKADLRPDVPTATQPPGAELLTTAEVTFPLKGPQDQGLDLPWSKGEDLQKKEAKAKPWGETSEEPSYVALPVIKRALIRGRIGPGQTGLALVESPAKCNLAQRH